MQGPTDWLHVLTLLAIVGSAMMAGVFFVFSVAVMRAFGQLPSSTGIAAMQAINRVIVNPLFLLVFLGTGVLCIGLAAGALSRWDHPGSPYLLSGALAYLLGSIGVTAVCNVPRNNALALVDPATAAGAALWQRYLREWTAWNHARTIACVLAAVAPLLGIQPRG